MTSREGQGREKRREEERKIDYSKKLLVLGFSWSICAWGAPIPPKLGHHSRPEVKRKINTMLY